MRGAIPVLSRALRADDAHPSVGLLGGATVLALQLIAAGRIRVTDAGDAWEAGPLLPADDDGVRRLAEARVHEGTDRDRAESVIRGLIDAVADAMTRTPVAPTRRAPLSAAAASARATRTGTCRPTSRSASGWKRPPSSSPRAWSPWCCRCTTATDSTHVADAAALWDEDAATGSRAGPGWRRRPSCAGPRPRGAPLERLLRERRARPDRCSTATSSPTCSSTVSARCCWPGSTCSGRGGCRPSSTARAEVEQRAGATVPLLTGLFGPEAMFALRLAAARLGERARSPTPRWPRWPRRPRRSSGCATTGWWSTRCWPAGRASGLGRSTPVAPVDALPGRAHRRARRSTARSSRCTRAPRCSRCATGSSTPPTRGPARPAARGSPPPCATTSCAA